jgi:hypothetical protein
MAVLSAFHRPTRPLPTPYTVISGFNTDVEYGGAVYHVQTEDKGAPSSMIMSLVYVGGTIIASKRVNYDELKKGPLISEKEIAEAVSRQHKLICAAIKAGKIEQLKAMSSPAGKTLTTASSPAASEPLEIAPIDAASAHAAVPQRSNSGAPPAEVAEPVLDAVEVVEDELILPAEAVAVVTEPTASPMHAGLAIVLLENAGFRGGERRSITLMICRGLERQPVPSAQIVVKVLGSTFRPVIYHANSDRNGLARVHLQVPKFQSGRAALVVRAVSDGEHAELRRLVTPA